jgi:hypothetical protein
METTGWMQALLVGTSLVGALGIGSAGLLHGAWLVGRGKSSLASVVPTGADGAPLFRPPWWATLGVTLGLLGTATAVVLAVLGVALPGVRAVLWISTIAFALRVVGDGRYAGLTKRQRSSTFARLDDRLYTPLALLFALGCGAALAV